MTDIFQGDPLITLGPNGSRVHYTGGQPILDQGVENLAIISLFSKPDWVGNALISNPDQQIGADFVEAANQPITIQSLTDVEQSAVRALDSPVFGRVTATATNPESDRLNVRILIEPPGQDSATIILTRNGLNWQAQATNPAHARIVPRKQPKVAWFNSLNNKVRWFNTSDDEVDWWREI